MNCSAVSTQVDTAVEGGSVRVRCFLKGVGARAVALEVSPRRFGCCCCAWSQAWIYSPKTIKQLHEHIHDATSTLTRDTKLKHDPNFKRDYKFSHDTKLLMQDEMCLLREQSLLLTSQRTQRELV